MIRLLLNGTEYGSVESPEDFNTFKTILLSDGVIDQSTDVLIMHPVDVISYNHIQTANALFEGMAAKGSTREQMINSALLLISYILKFMADIAKAHYDGTDVGPIAAAHMQTLAPVYTVFNTHPNILDIFTSNDLVSQVLKYSNDATSILTSGE